MRLGLVGWFFLLILSSTMAAVPQASLEQRVGDLSQQIVKEMTENQKRTIAVVEFTDLKGNVTDLGRFLAEELTTRMYQTKKFKVIERQLLNKIIAEQKLSLTGVVDPASAKKLGQILGVDAIASGTITDLAQSLRINARLIDTQTGEIFAAASTEIFKDDSVIKLLSSESPRPEPARKEDGAGSKATEKAFSKVEAKFFTFELQRCRISGTTVICDLMVTNNERDRQLGISNESSMFDDAGNGYSAYELRNVQLANATGSGLSGNAESLLISGVQTRARVTFDRVSPQATKISLLTLKCYSGDFFTVQFRGIPLTK